MRAAARGNVREWWRAVAARFRRARLAFGHGTTNARDEAAWLVGHVVGIDFADFPAAQARAVDAVAARRIEALAHRRITTREPLAYILREAWLRDRRFYVDPRVIVPRSHIAELLPDGLRAWLPRGGPRRILDLCTGSGCLAILAALAYPSARVDALDISAAALAVARRNIAAYRLARRVRLVRSDFFAALSAARYDLILCNPPYVPAREMRRLPPEYRHEPALALGSGDDGLDFVRRLLAEAGSRLAPRGLLVVEVGDGRRAVERAFPRLPFTWLETSAGSGLVFLVSAAAF
jgi:ribosomal protein L3 glutamine methyltransferase